MRWYEELDEDRLTYDEERGRSVLALFLSLLFYALFFAFIFLEIPYLPTQSPGIIPLGNDLFDNLPRRSTPARVISLPPPTKNAVPAQPKVSPKPTMPVVQPPAPTPTTPQPESSPAESIPATSLPIPENNGRSGGVEINDSKKTTELSPTELSPTVLPARRGRSSWAKNPIQSSSPTQVRPETGYSGNRGQVNAFSGFEKISAERVNRLPESDGTEDGDPTYGSPLGRGGPASPKVIARNMEFELFATRLVHNICDTSRQQPLRVSHGAIPLHTIVISITVARDRRITGVRFMQASPHQIINHYLEGMLRTTLAPQLPASWRENELTMPLHIHIKSMPETSEIWLIPIEKT